MGKMSEGIALLRKVVALDPIWLRPIWTSRLPSPTVTTCPGPWWKPARLSALLRNPESPISIVDGFCTTWATPPKHSLSSKPRSQLVPQMPEPHYFLALIYKQEGKFSLAARPARRDRQAAAPQRDGLVFAGPMPGAAVRDRESGRGLAAGHRH